MIRIWRYLFITSGSTANIQYKKTAGGAILQKGSNMLELFRSMLNRKMVKVAKRLRIRACNIIFLP
jgi:hypothetical protein